MNERSGTVRFVEPRGDSEAAGLVTTIPRGEVEDALRSDATVDLMLDVDRVAADGEGRETERVTLTWEPQDLERLLATSSDDQITLTFDEGELQQLLDEDVDAHGMREKLAVVSVVAGLAVAGAGSAAAMYAPSGADGGSASAPAVVAPASEVSTGIGATAPAAATAATASEVSTGIGTAPAAAPTAASPSEISTGMVGEPAAAPSEISSGIVQEPLASPSEISTGVGQQPTASPVSASPGDSSWAPSPETGALVGGAILAIAVAGFAVSTQRRGPATA
jgi:hypothetical protein